MTAPPSALPPSPCRTFPHGHFHLSPVHSHHALETVGVTQEQGLFCVMVLCLWYIQEFFMPCDPSMYSQYYWALPHSTDVILKIILRVILCKSKRKTSNYWICNGHPEAGAKVKLSSGPSEDFQMMHILLERDADIPNGAEGASPTWNEDSHKTSQWSTSYTENLCTDSSLSLPRSSCLSSQP